MCRDEYKKQKFSLVKKSIFLVTTHEKKIIFTREFLFLF